MRRPVAIALAFAAWISTCGQVAADSRGTKLTEQHQSGDVTLVVGRDGSLTQPTPSGGGRLTCALWEHGPSLESRFDQEVDGGLVEGTYYWLTCDDAAGNQVVARFFQYEPGVSVIDPASLAERARSELAITYPEPRTSPAIDIDQIVGIETWLWIDPSAWQPLTATAAIPGLSVTATATPKQVTWDMGDGTIVTCHGPGTPYDDARSPSSQTTDCGHVYQYAGRYDATATMTWSVSWSASDGTNGNLADVTRTTRFPLTVIQRQAVGR